MRWALLLMVLAIPPGCRPAANAPAIDTAKVVARNASVRRESSSSSRTLLTLNPGDQVEVLQQVDNWYRIRKGTEVEGWMEASTVLTAATEAQALRLVEDSRRFPVQNTVTTREAANLRIEPGRSTTVIRRLDRGQTAEVLERLVSDRPGGGKDVWLRIRPAPDQVGWILASLADFDIPGGISQYSEGYAYTAVRELKEVEDEVAGTVRWYVVAERASDDAPELDFSGIRVFTWDMARHRYETAFRLRGLRGRYPLVAVPSTTSPSFRITESNADGATVTRDFQMNGVVVRERRPATRP